MTEDKVKYLIFGRYSQEEILKAVKDSGWQTFRKLLKGLTTESKIRGLHSWLRINGYTLTAKIQITNYINALKRGGQITK